MRWIRYLWRAASNPRAFFAALPTDPALVPATSAALLSLLVGSLVFAWALVRATASTAWLPIMVFVVPGVLLFTGALWLLGGLALSRVGELDLRGWEIAAWAWVPAGFVALSLLPVVAVFPVSSLAAGTLGLPLWHLAVVRAGVAEFATRRRRRALLTYALVVLAAPLTALFVGVIALFVH